jgi:hypothetical protein
MRVESEQLSLFELPEELLPCSVPSSFPFLVVEADHSAVTHQSVTHQDLTHSDK